MQFPIGVARSDASRSGSPSKFKGPQATKPTPACRWIKFHRWPNAPSTLGGASVVAFEAKDGTGGLRRGGKLAEASNLWGRNASVVVLVGLLLWGTMPCLARLKMGISDADLVNRTEIIAVGHLKPGSVEHIKVAEGSFVYHAMLVVGEVLKGKAAAKEIPIFVCNGLRCDFPGNTNRSRTGFAWEMVSNGRTQHMAAPEPKTITIHDFDSDYWPMWNQVVADATLDGLWFLHRQKPPALAENAASPLGVNDSRQMQPLVLKEYFRAYLVPEPETAVRKAVEQQPAVAPRARLFLEAFEIQRILADPDPKVRLEKLLPYYLRNPYQDGVGSGVVACGPTALIRLRGVFNDPKYEGNVFLRSAIIRLWGEQQDRDAVPLLIALLEKHQRFWVEQALFEGWWNQDFNSPLTRQRHGLYHEVNAAVRALGQLGDERGRAVIELTKRGWEQRDSNGNSQILEGCIAALQAMNRTEK